MQRSTGNANAFRYDRLDTDTTLFPVGLGLAKGLTMRGYSLFEVVNFPEKFERAKRHVFYGLERGDYQPVIDTTFPLARILQGHPPNQRQ